MSSCKTRLPHVSRKKKTPNYSDIDYEYKCFLRANTNKITLIKPEKASKEHQEFCKEFYDTFIILDFPEQFRNIIHGKPIKRNKNPKDPAKQKQRDQIKLLRNFHKGIKYIPSKIGRAHV